MRTFNKLLLVFLFSCALGACEEVFFEKDTPSDPVANFEYLWTRMNQNYSLFDFKGIDWDSIYAVYRPRVSENTNPTELFYIMTDMLNSLEDGHTNLRSEFDVQRYFPYLEANPNFNFDLVERSYLGIDYRFTGFLLNQVIDSVGYIYYRSFQRPIKEWELDTVIRSFNNQGVKGVIIDIRDNEGGNPANGRILASRLINERTHIYSSQKKSGPGPDDFDPVQEIFLNPNTSNPPFPGKVVVLINRKVYSAGSYFAASIKAIPDVQLIGDTTGGGSGVPAGFDLPNGWYCNYSSTIGTLFSGENFEAGVAPDIFLELDTLDLLDGRDTIIEYALREIKSE